MPRFSKYILVFAILILSGCAEEWLDRKPQNIILEEQVWNDSKMITGLLANYYDRLPAHTSLTTGWAEFAAYDEAMWSNNDDGRNNIVSYPFDRWRYWDYGLIRDINLAIENIEKFSTSLSETQKTQFSAEFRFLRAFVYFELVKTNGRGTAGDQAAHLRL
jgi:hypothetical protein